MSYLGERQSPPWWTSSFFSEESESFLAPAFPRSKFLAQYAGAVQAAARVHDERIGVGSVYHLFRLPETVEQAIRRTFHDEQFANKLAKHIKDTNPAIAFLRSSGDSPKASSVGPTLVGSVQQIVDLTSWRKVAGEYAHAFETKREMYPFFADRQ